MGVAISGASTTRRWNVSGTNKLEWRLMADFRIHGPTSVVQAGDAYPRLQAVRRVSQAVPRHGHGGGHPPVPVAPFRGGREHLQSHFLAAISCWIKARKLWLEAEDLDDAREMRAWRSIAIAFLALGVNKQLDLQTALTEVGRVLANSQGWYAQRQSVQVVRSLAWSPLSFW